MQQARAAIFFITEAAKLLIGVDGGLIILRVAIKLAELLVKNGERAGARRQALLLGFDAGDGVGKHANGIFVAALRLVQHGFVVHDFETAGSVLAGFDEIVFGFVELMKLAVNLRHAEINVGVIRHQVGQFLVDGEGVGIFFFGHEGLAETALVAEFGGIKFGGFAIGDFRFRQVVRLRVSVAEKIEHRGRRRARGYFFEQRDGFGGFAFVEEQLGELLDGRLVVGIFLQHAAQDGFGFVVFVAQAIEAREPERGFGVAGIEAVNFGVLLDGASDNFGLAVADAEIAEAAQINAAEQAARLNVVGIALEQCLRFGDGFVSALRFPIHFGEAFADYRRFGIERVGFFVSVDGLRGVFGLAGGFVLLLVDVAHREVVIGVGARGSFGDFRRGRGGLLVGHRGGICPARWRRRAGAGVDVWAKVAAAPMAGREKCEKHSLRVHESPKKKVSHAPVVRSKVKGAVVSSGGHG